MFFLHFNECFGVFTSALVQEVGQETAHDGLVADDQDVPLSFQLHYYRLQPLHQILVGLHAQK